MDFLAFAAILILVPGVSGYILALRFARPERRRAWTLAGAAVGFAILATVFSWGVYIALAGLPWQQRIYERNVAGFKRAIYRGESKSALEKRIPHPDYAFDSAYLYIRRSSFCVVQFSGFHVRFDRRQRVESWKHEDRADGC